MIDALAVVEDGAQVSASAVVWRWSLIRRGVFLGEGVKVGSLCVIGPDVHVGDGCKVEDGAKLYGPLTLGQHVFVGPNVVICNDRHPTAAQYDWQPSGPPTRVGDGASIGANAVIMPGLLIGFGAVIGAGAIVTHDVPAGAMWCGAPAR